MSAPDQTAFQKWYAEHKEEFNRKRKERYKSDKKYRKAIIQRQEIYRENNPRESVQELKHYRNVNGSREEVFRLGAVSQMVGRSEQMIRKWEKDGKIPRPTVPGAHRYYTMSQVKLLIEFAELMDQVVLSVEKVPLGKVPSKKVGKGKKPSVRMGRLGLFALRELAMQKKSAEIHAIWEEV